MKTLSWNCRGLGNPGTVQTLCQLVKKNNPDLVFLMETRCSNQKGEGIRRRVGFNNGVGIDAKGGGGLQLWWKEASLVHLLSLSEGHIDVVIQSVRKPPWRLTGFYGNPVKEKRHESWELLRRLKRCNNLPWVCIGDFNEILFHSEKWGGNMREERQMDAFQDVLREYELSDLGYKGNTFTWAGRRRNVGMVRERLDRAIGTNEWRLLFPLAMVRVLTTATSDHEAILLDIQGRTVRARRGFRFEWLWTLEPTGEGVIRANWRVKPKPGQSVMSLVIQNTRGCSEQLGKWSRSQIQSVKHRISEREQQLESIRSQLPIDTDLERAVQIELRKFYQHEEIYWRQRSRVQWLKEGDRNTSFFHKRATQRFNRNWIDYLYAFQFCKWVDEPAGVRNIFTDFFKDLFTSSGSRNLQWLDDLLSLRVTPEMTQYLQKPYTMEEVKSALFEMHPQMASPLVSFRDIGKWLV